MSWENPVSLEVLSEAEGAMTQLELTQLEPPRRSWTHLGHRKSPTNLAHLACRMPVLSQPPPRVGKPRAEDARATTPSPNIPQLQGFFEARLEKESRLEMDPYMEAQEPEVAPTMPRHAALTERLDLEVPVENRQSAWAMRCPASVKRRRTSYQPPTG